MGATQSKDNYWMRVVSIFFVGWAIIWTYRTILTPIYPEIQSSLGIATDARMSMIPSVFYAFYVLMQIPSGLIADRYGRKKTVMAAFCIFAFGMAVMSFSGTFEMMLIGAALVGIGQSAYFGCAFSITNSVVSSEKSGFASAIVNSGCGIGMAAGLLASSYFVTAIGVDWRVLLRILSVLTLGFVLVYGFGLKNDSPAPAAKKEKGQENGEPFLKTILNPKLIAAFALYFATCYGYYMVVTWLPAFLQEERAIGGVMTGYISSIVAFTAIPGALLISRWADRNREKKIGLMAVLEVVSAATLFIAVSTGRLPVLAAALAAYGFFGKMAVDPIIVSYLVQNAPKAAYGRALAFLNFFGMSASVVSAYSTGVLSDTTGSRAGGFYIACVLLIAATILLVFMNKKKK